MFCDPCPEVIVKEMVKSVRKHMDCEIIQLTDWNTKKLDCVDSVHRLKGGIVSSFLARHLANLHGDTLYLDYDTVVREDVSKVFEQDFDLAITRRSDKELASALLYRVCPNNVGVMFCRNQDFWRQVARRYDARIDPPSWMKFQIIVTEAMNALDFNILELPSEKYNYTPETRDEELTCAIAHYKGYKKSWMVAPEDEKTALDGEKMVAQMMIKQGGVLAVSPDHPGYETLRA